MTMYVCFLFEDKHAFPFLLFCGVSIKVRSTFEQVLCGLVGMPFFTLPVHAKYLRFFIRAIDLQILNLCLIDP